MLVVLTRRVGRGGRAGAPLQVTCSSCPEPCPGPAQPAHPFRIPAQIGNLARHGPSPQRRIQRDQGAPGRLPSGQPDRHGGAEALQRPGHWRGARRAVLQPGVLLCSRRRRWGVGWKTLARVGPPARPFLLPLLPCCQAESCITVSLDGTAQVRAVWPAACARQAASSSCILTHALVHTQVPPSPTNEPMVMVTREWLRPEGFVMNATATSADGTAGTEAAAGGQAASAT